MTNPVNGDALTALREALIAKLSDEMDPDGAVAMVRRFEDALIAAGRSTATTEPCEWTADDEGIYRTACGQDFVSMDGDSPDFIKFCCYCGKPARIVPESEASAPAPTVAEEG